MSTRRTFTGGPTVADTRDASLLHGHLSLAGRLDTRFFALLEALHATGSLHKAARTAGYSYKGAWLVLDTASNLSRAPLVSSASGGSGGGGTRLTEAALDLLAAWTELQTRHAAFLHMQEAWLTEHTAVGPLLRRFAMKASARNQFFGTVRALHRGPATTQIELDIGGGLTVAASITTDAATELNLAPGSEAIALVQASEIVLVSDFAGFRLSARNQLPGTIARIQRGAVTAMVGLVLPGGSTLTASVSHDAVDALGLAIGQPVTATFKAYSVMLAVAA